MEILQFLLSFLSKGLGEDFSGLFNHLKNNDFNLKKVLQNIDLSVVLPLIEKFILNGQKNTRSENFQERNIAGLNPIAQIADKDIIYSLNKYFYSN